MKKSEKFEPHDSVRNEKEDRQVVKRAADKRYQRKDPQMDDPAAKRTTSEQPPTKHNAKT
jgi:hypothetical protein